MKSWWLIFALLTLIAYSIPEISNARKDAVTKNDSLSAKLRMQIDAINSLLARTPVYNTRIACIIDFRMSSGSNRFFVVDLQTKKILQQGLVAHGVNSEPGTDGQMRFSNEINSYCSSLGNYVIGNSYKGRFGKSYKLIGLDSSNSNALNRAIVLHSYECVPDAEQTTPICNSLGCPMVSVNFFARLQKIIDGSNKKIILRICY